MHDMASKKTPKSSSKKTKTPKPADLKAPEKPGRILLRERLAERGYTPSFPLVSDPVIGKEAAKENPEVAAYDELLRQMGGLVEQSRKRGEEMLAHVTERTRNVAANARAQMLARYLRAEGMS